MTRSECLAVIQLGRDLAALRYKNLMRLCDLRAVDDVEGPVEGLYVHQRIAELLNEAADQLEPQVGLAIYKMRD
jgi:hypothetical protein